MKKIYIKPQNTVAYLNVESMIAGSIHGTNDVLNVNGGTAESDIVEGGAREVISVRDTWEEW